jgi:hypothetical protein
VIVDRFQNRNSRHQLPDVFERTEETTFCYHTSIVVIIPRNTFFYSSRATVNNLAFNATT